jgi:hypothetical protein
MIKRLLILTLFASSLGVSFAQDYRGTVQGLVTDSSQAVIAGAKVTLLNVNTGVSVTKESSNLGDYRFDLVEPGTYKVEAVAAGFSKSIQQNVAVETGGDVTVNFTLQPGRLSQSVTVTANPVALQLNTTTKDLTVTSTQLAQLPFQERNPFTAALLDPAVVNVYPYAPKPYYMWQATEMDFGGQTSRENDVLIDGSSTVIGPKGSYTPTIEGVQEEVVEQVAVDAEYGHSAGGVISMSTPQGTNKLHGSAFYYGINPSLNAVSNAISRTPSVSRSNIWGGSAGGPIKKNKLFDFFDYEGRRGSTPNTTVMTLPTAAERTGDYSQSLNSSGGLRTIYNPFTTVVDPVTGAQTRTPFTGNLIPPAMLDPTALKMMSYIWKPNTTPANSAGADNFRSTVGLGIQYYNFSDRVDWNQSDKLRIFGRYSQFHASNSLPDYTGMNSPAENNGSGGVMLSKSFSGDGVYTLNPSTVIDVRFGYSSQNDDIAVANMSASAFAGLWPGNTWYQSYSDQWAGKILFPYLAMGPGGGAASFSEQYLWFQHPHSYNLAGKLVRTQGRHSLKAGLETRRQAAYVSLPVDMTFNFLADTTSSTSINAPTAVSGDPYATFLLGAPADGSAAYYSTPSRVSIFYYGAYAQDDFKVSRRITLNLGLRYEYESAPVDAQNRFTRYLDLNSANSTLAANPPQYSVEETALRSQYLGSGAATPPPNGNWIFATSSNRTQFNAPGFSLAPRAGIALRLNDKTVLNAGYGRFLVLNSQVQDGLLSNNQNMYVGYSATSTILPSQQGVPVSALANPFPSNNPLQAVRGNSLGPNTNLGNGFGDDWGDGFRDQNYKDGRVDRFNLTIERELPGKLRADISFVAHNGRHLDSYGMWDSFPANEANPNLYYNPTTGPAMTQQYPNPFYHYLTPSQFPGGLRNQPTVSLWQLLRPYPQYKEIFQGHVPAEGDTVRNVEFRVQRPYSNGMNLLASYVYNHEQQTAWPDAGDNVGSDGPFYYSQKPLWMEGTYPRHRARLSGIYDLPVGRGRKMMSQVNPWVDGVLGGWSASSIVNITSGKPLRFSGNYAATGNPAQNIPTGLGFNPNAFALLPDYALFSGPLVFPGVDGPVQWNIDAQLSKSFRIREGMRLQFRMEAYNLTNSIVFAPEDYPYGNGTSYGDPTFGLKNLYQYNIGRTLQYSLRLSF